MSNYSGIKMSKFEEGDVVLLKATVFRADNSQALIEFESMKGPYSVRVPLSELINLSIRTDY